MPSAISFSFNVKLVGKTCTPHLLHLLQPSDTKTHSRNAVNPWIILASAFQTQTTPFLLHPFCEYTSRYPLTVAMVDDRCKVASTKRLTNTCSANDPQETQNAPQGDTGSLVPEHCLIIPPLPSSDTSFLSGAHRVAYLSKAHISSIIKG